MARQIGLRAKLRQFRDLVSAIGLLSAIGHYLHQKRGRPQGSVYFLRPYRAIHPLQVRSDTSDIGVFSQIFIELEYACLDDLKGVEFIVDCGANVGYSSAYFLSRFPNCHVVAIEPDPNNFAMLQQNMAAYGNRVKTIQAGVWSHPARLVIADSPYRDGQAWSKQVRECTPDEESQIVGIDIATVLADAGRDRISILKIDVEGAEVVIFFNNYESWLNRVDAIAIELHDDSSFGSGTKAFHAAIDGLNFEISHSGELTVCKRTHSAK